MVSLQNLPRPFVVGVVVERTAAAATRSAESAFQDGADAIELNLASLRDAPGPEFFRRAHGPVYTSCRRAGFMAVYGKKFGRLPELSDDERMQRQFNLIAAGSAGLDIEADAFAPDPGEWTRDRAAIRRQTQLAAATRRAGAAVVFSWHPPRKLRMAEALRAACTLRDRGATFVKIVERVRSRAEALDSLAISLRLGERFAGRCVFLALGPEAVRFRPLMASFGAAYLLARPALGSNRLAAQPPVARARTLADLA